MTAGRSWDWTRIAGRSAFAGFIASLLLGLLLPLYTDEVGWRMQLRAGIDGGVDRMLNDVCGPTSIVAPPWFMMPFRIVPGWLDLAFPDPLYIRLLGVGVAIAWAFLLLALIRRVAGDSRRAAVLTALVFGLLGLGVFPLMLTMNRPDQVVLLAMTGALLAARIGGERERRGWRAWVWPLAIAAMGLTAASFHMKGILLSPLFLVCIALAGSGRASRPARLAAAALYAVLAVQAADYWIDRFRCPADPVLAKRLAGENLAGALAAVADWRDLIVPALERANPGTYVAIAQARPHLMSDWLPRNKISDAATLVRYVPMSIAWTLAALLALICLGLAARDDWRNRRLTLTTAAPLALAGIVLVWGMSQSVKNDYEIAVVLPALGLFILFPLAGTAWSEANRKRLGIAAIVLTGLSLGAQADIARRYAPPLLEAARQPGYIRGQDASFSAFGFGRIRGQILATARVCGIGTKGRAKRPLLDDGTYFAFVDSHAPFHYLSVLGHWRGRIEDPIAYLGSRGSEGMILACKRLKPALRRRAFANGEFCCIPTR
jgi:hypothetical protein